MCSSGDKKEILNTGYINFVFEQIWDIISNWNLFEKRNNLDVLNVIQLSKCQIPNVMMFIYCFFMYLH